MNHVLDILEKAKCILSASRLKGNVAPEYVCWCVIMACNGKDPSEVGELYSEVSQLPLNIRKLIDDIGEDFGCYSEGIGSIQSYEERQAVRFMYIEFLILSILDDTFEVV